LGELCIAFCALAVSIVEYDRFAETWRFGKPHVAWNYAFEDLRSKKLRKSVATWRESEVRSSYMVSRIPSISRLGFSVRRMRIRVSSNSETPSSAKYSHWMGTKTAPAATRAFKVNKSKAGGQSRMI